MDTTEKNKILIPAELRGCILSTIQKAKDFRVGIVNIIENSFPEDERRIHSIQREIDEWKAEIAEYDAVLAALTEKQDGKEKIS